MSNKIIHIFYRQMMMVLVMSVICLCAVLPAVAEEEQAVEATVTVGGRCADGDDDLSRAAEYSTQDEDGAATVTIDLFAGDTTRYVTVEGAVNNEDDLNTTMEIQVNPNVRNSFSFKRYLHRLDHDRLENLTARESVNPDENTPGGKMVTHENQDTDELYGIVISDLTNELAVDMGKHVTAGWTYRHMTRKGHKQTRSVNHCAMCHVVGRKTEVNEEQRDHTLGIELDFPKVNIMYQFVQSEFQNHAAVPTNYWEPARHPVSGETGEEFASRTVFQDEELPYSRIPDTKKQSHVLKLQGDVGAANTIVAHASLVNLENKLENLEMETKYGAFKWLYRPSKKFSFKTTVTREEIDNDDVLIDLPAWRDGGSGGGQDFDWTRYSAYNRDVTIARLHSSYAFSDTQALSFDYRYRSIDREYLEVQFDSTETESSQNRFIAAWNTRSTGFRGRIAVEYEMTDYPFANQQAMCESPAAEGSPIPDNSSYYYFQRERRADASNQPTDALKLNANFTVLSGSKLSLNLQGSYQDEKNDDLNSYEFNQTALVTGLNIFATPNTKTALTIGYNYLNIESNALFCVPVMDG